MPPSMNICETCKERKEVCCGYDESAKGLSLRTGKEFPGPSYCVNCCPWKEEHIESRRKCGCVLYGADPLCACGGVLKFIVEVPLAKKLYQCTSCMEVSAVL
jgi:hypothetical protein